MRDEGILDGDYVIIERRDIARNGDRVVALLPDGRLLKTFFREPDHIRLQPANPAFEPIRVKDCKIQGVDGARAGTEPRAGQKQVTPTPRARRSVAKSTRPSPFTSPWN